MKLNTIGIDMNTEIDFYEIGEEEYGDYSPGRFAWITDNCRPVKPFPVVGQQGLFNVDDDLIEYL